MAHGHRLFFSKIARRYRSCPHSGESGRYCGLGFGTPEIGKVYRAMGNKVVLVDDDQLVLLSVSQVLEASGYQVWATDSTEQAVALTREVKPDVVVTDYRMPGMDGVSLLARMRELRAVPLMVVYSATPPPGGGPRRRLQDVYWVAKSAGHRALLEKLRDLLEGGVDPR